MRRVLVLAFLAAAPGCRRAPPVEPTVAREIAPAAGEAAAPEPAAPPVPPPAATPEQPPPAANAPAAAMTETTTATATTTTAAPAVGGPEAPAPPDDEAEDQGIYSWTDERGTVHYGMASEAPRDRRRAVEGGITIVPSRTFDAPSVRSEGDGGAPPPSEPQDPPARGPRPQLDAQGLPVPGTMDDTAHTRAVQQASGVHVDPASVERQRATDNQRMNCVEKDGATVCSGE